MQYALDVILESTLSLGVSTSSLVMFENKHHLSRDRTMKSNCIYVILVEDASRRGCFSAPVPKGSLTCLALIRPCSLCASGQSSAAVTTTQGK